MFALPIRNVDAMQSSTQDTSSPALDPKSSKEHGEEDTIREEEVVHTAPKDMRFWLVMVGLLFATFISALDLTGKFVCLFDRNPSKTSLNHYFSKP